MSIDIQSVIQSLYTKYVNKDAVKAAVPNNVNINNALDVLNYTASQNGGGNDGINKLISLAQPLINMALAKYGLGGGGGKFDFNSILGMVQGVQQGGTTNNADLSSAFDLDITSPDFPAEAEKLGAYWLAKADVLELRANKLASDVTQIRKVVTNLGLAIKTPEATVNAASVTVDPIMPKTTPPSPPPLPKPFGTI